MLDQLTRSTRDKKAAGVCSGIAKYMDIDPVFVRLAFVILTLATGLGIPIYLVLMLCMSADSQEKSPLDVDPLYKPSPDTQRRQRNLLFTGILVILGIFLLMGNFHVEMYLLPIVLIGLGVWFVTRRS